MENNGLLKKLFPFLRSDDDLSLDEIYEKGNRLIRKCKYREAFLLYKYAAEQGHVPSECKVTLCYHKGLGVQANIEEALRWMRLAANHGYAFAQYHLATYSE